MNDKAKFWLIGGSLLLVGVLVFVYMTFQNKQKEKEAEYNAALLQAQQNGNNQPTVLGTVQTGLGLINTIIQTIRSKKKTTDPTSSGTVTGSEVKNYIANNNISQEDLGGINVEALAGTTWNGSETYGG